MKRLILSIFALVLGVSFANAQAPTKLCFTTNGTNCVEVQSSNPLPTTSISSAALAALTYSSSAALAANQIVKASPGNLYSFQVGADATLSGGAWWVMIYDAVTAPADGAVTPAKCYAVPSGTAWTGQAFNVPVRFSVGIVIGVSTTGCFNKTASTHAFISGDAQ